MDKCIFCMIANHEIPGKILYEDDQCLAFLDLSQTTKGHTLVIPKQHFTHFIDVDTDTLQHMIVIAQKVAKLLIKKTNAKGMNIISNMNEVAGQTVHHFHIHLIPRYHVEDGIKIQYTDNSSNINIDDVYQSIKEL